MAIQRAFASGEVDPALYGRSDVDRWKAALKTCRNWIVQPEGGINVRQGFELKARVAYTSADNIRLMPFEFGPNDSYVQVFADDTMYLVKDGALVTGDTVRSASLDCSLTPWKVTQDLATAGHGFSTGDQVTFYSGIAAGDTYTITKVDAWRYTLNTTTATSGTYDVLVRRTSLVSGTPPVASYPFPASYPFDDIRMVQSGDTQYLASGDRSPVKLVRELYTGVDRALSFQREYIVGYPSAAEVATLSVTGTAGTDQVRYRITYTDRDGNESAVLRSSTQASTAISGTTTLTVTKATHGLITNDTILIHTTITDDSGNEVYKAGDLVRVVRVDANNFTIPGSDSGATVTGPIYWYRISASALLTSPTSSAATTVTWSAVTNAVTYNVFREYGRVYGYIGSTSDTTFTDKGIIPDQTDTPVVGISPFRSSDAFDSGNHPRAVGLFQQRLMFGGFEDDIERVVGSFTGNYDAYDPGAEGSSGLDFTLGGRTVSGVQHMVEVAGRVVILTDTAEWVLRGGTTGAITPTAINARVDSYFGCSDIVPSLIGSSILYVQRGDRIIRDAKYDYAQEALASNDLTLWAKHLFKAEVKRLYYQRTAQILWVLRKDGVLLGLTYIPEQNIWGWHRHDIDGRAIHDICVVSESGTDRLYCTVLDDDYVNVCRLPLVWESEDVDDHKGFDLSLSYDGTLAATGTLTGGTDWTTDESLTLTASASVFVVGDVGKTFLLRSGSNDVYVECTAYTSGTVVTVSGTTIIPEDLQGVASESMARCATTFSGLDHLEGETVGIIADRGTEPDAVVASGAIETSRPFAKVQVGLHVTCVAQTLDLEPDEGDTYLGDMKHLTHLWLRLRDTRGLEAGTVESSLSTYPPEFDTLTNGTPTLASGQYQIIIDAVHELSGSVYLKQTTGLPATVLNLRPVFNVGDFK